MKEFIKIFMFCFLVIVGIPILVYGLFRLLIKVVAYNPWLMSSIAGVLISLVVATLVYQIGKTD